MNHKIDNFVGDLASQFVEIRQLGEGAEGGALMARERQSDRRVVLKRIPAEHRRASCFAFGVLRRTGSPHLPAPRALFETDDGATWMVTDWVAGAPLPLERAKSPVDALAEARSVAHALAAIHGAGTHHGDVSPGNVVVTPTGGVVLVDLGQLGRRGLGTPGFLAPEVLAGGGGPPADRFSLGCLLCLRLLGEVPWRRPAALLDVRDLQGVQARLDSLGAATLEPSVRALLGRLLHPDPLLRLADSQALVSHLTRLLAAANAGLDLGCIEPWWRPARWPYRGPDLQGVVHRLVQADAPRLVAIAGPRGVGRGRVVEELVQSLQAEPHAPPARVCEVGRVSSMLGQPEAPWLEAWRRAPNVGLLGLMDPPGWPPNLGGEHASIATAAVLMDVAHQAQTTLVIPVEPSVGEALAERGVPLIRVKAWSVTDIAAVLEGVVDPRLRSAWAQCLWASTGGWPARVIRAAQACATAELDDPHSPRLPEAIASAAEAGYPLTLGLARQVMLATWRTTEAVDALPAHLHDGERPWADVEASARRYLGSELRELAEQVALMVEHEGDRLSMTLAIDADRPAAVEAYVRDGHDGSVALDRWLDSGGAGRIGSAAVELLMRRRLAHSDLDGVLHLAPSAPSAAGRLLLARAMQRKGQLDEAIAMALEASTSDHPPTAWRARGLQWRLWIDKGQGDVALRAAREALSRAPTSGLGPATARLWAAMAALVTSEHDQAQRWLDEALDAIGGDETVEAAGIRARVHQLHGNLAQARGQLRRAQQCYGQAAEAFDAAGEPVGGLILRGSLAGLAVLAYDFEVGLEHGRAALGGLVAQGQLSATLEAGLNLMQLLVGVGAEGQARALARRLDELHAHDQSPLVVARRLRIQAELATLKLYAHGHRAKAPGSADQAAAEAHFVTAAQHLAAAGAEVEATEAWRRAAGLARVQGQADRARAHWEHAVRVASDEPDVRAELELEGVMQRLAADDASALDDALARLSRLPSSRQWCERGRLDLAWTYDRALLLALCRRLPSDHVARRRAAQRWRCTLDLIMKQTGPLDRSAVRNRLFAEGGDTQPLRDLLAELDEPVASARRGPPPPASADPRPEFDRHEQLLRIYRRLAREQRIEVLLQQVVDAMMDLTDAERGAVVVLPTEHTERLEVTRELAEGSEGVRFSRSVIERVLTDGDPVISVDAAADDRFDGSRSISHLNLRSVLAVPLRFRGEHLGAAYVDHRLRRGNFDESDLARMEEFAELAALAVAHARALAELRAQADALSASQAQMSRMLEAREVEVISLRDQVRSAPAPDPQGYRGMIGKTPVMIRIFKLIDRVADADLPVVIHGQSGTGKELVARALHDAGPRREGPFIAENCGAIPETLLESVLFGHLKGAFTGASGAKAGLFEAANGGTIFLDEVGEMSAAMQTKLLRVLQEGEVRRVGDHRARRIDVRVIAASNRSLEDMVERGEFRRDLYYRINVIKIELPTLRERIDDLPALVEYFGRRFAPPDRPLHVTAAAMRRLAQYEWPGNVRELENEVQRWVALVEGPVGPDDLTIGSLSRSTTTTTRAVKDDDDLQIRPRIEQMERALVERAMARTGGNQTQAAALLGLSRYGLQKKLRRWADHDHESSSG